MESWRCALATVAEAWQSDNDGGGDGGGGADCSNGGDFGDGGDGQDMTILVFNGD